MKKLSLLFIAGLTLLSACGSESGSGWQKRTGSVGNDKLPAIFYVIDKDPTEELPVTGSISLLKTDISYEFILYGVEFKIFDTWKPNAESSGLSIQNGGFGYTNSEVVAKFPSMSSVTYAACKFADPDRNDYSYSLEGLNWKIDNRYDIHFSFTYTNAANVNVNFSHTIELEKK